MIWMIKLCITKKRYEWLSYALQINKLLTKKRHDWYEWLSYALQSKYMNDEIMCYKVNSYLCWAPICGH